MTAHGDHVRAGYTVGAHDLADIAVVVSCSCGDLFAGDSHEHAMALWERHAERAAMPDRLDDDGDGRFRI